MAACRGLQPSLHFQFKRLQSRPLSSATSSGQTGLFAVSENGGTGAQRELALALLSMAGDRYW